MILIPFLISIWYFYDFDTFSYFNAVLLWFCYLSCFHTIFLWFCYLFWFQYDIAVILLPFLISKWNFCFCDFAAFSFFNIILLWFCYLFWFQSEISVSVILLPFVFSILYCCDFATFFFLDIIYIIYFSEKVAKCMIWYDFGSIHYAWWRLRITHGDLGKLFGPSDRSEPFCQAIGKGSRHANWPGAETCLAALEADLLAEAANHDGSHWILSSLARHHPRCLFVFLFQNI